MTLRRLLALAWVLLAASATPAAHALDESPWRRVPTLVDLPLDGGLDVTEDARRHAAVVSFPFDVSLGGERWQAAIVGPGWAHLLAFPLPEGDAESDEARLLDVPRLGPRLDVLAGERIRLAPRGRVLVAVHDELVVIRWTALETPGARGFATVELALEPQAITAQYLAVPRGFVAGAAAPTASAYALVGAPGDVTRPFDPPPAPQSTDPPPSGCDPETGDWCDITGSECTQNAGVPGPGGTPTPCSTRVSNLWRFAEGEFCLDCPYRFYILVECGRDMHLPTYDMEGLDLEITNMVTGQKPDLRCVNETARGLGSSRSWRNPPNCAGKPGPWWAPPLDVTNNAGPGRVSFSDSTPGDGHCTTRYDVPCSEVPSSGAAPTVNYGEEQTIDCFISDELGLCGIYRVDIISGGNGWQLFANCDGTNTPQFDIFFDCTEAWSAYNPLPELAIANVSASGSCWTYDVSFDVQNIGCVDEPADVPVRITSDCGDSLDLIVPGPIPAHGSITYTQPMTLSCPDGVLTFTVDPDDVIAECTETSSAAACQATTGIDTFDAPVTCCPVVGAGTDKAACAGAPVSLLDASSQFADTFLWSDGGAGGAFSPGADVRNPTYTPSSTPGSVTLTLRGTYSGSGCFREDSLVVTVNPLPAVDAGLASSACVGETISLAPSPDFADQFLWSDGGAGGTFAPSPFVASPTYRNSTPGDHVLTFTGTDVPTACSASDTVTVTFFAAPAPDAGVDRQACACEPVPLVDAQGGGATTFAWSDGGAGGAFLPSASVASPTYVGTGSGIVTLSLTGTNAVTGCSATDRLVVELVDCPEADAGSPLEACTGDAATLFDASGGSATDYRWDDGGAGGTFAPSATELNPTYANPALGTHVLTLVATDRSAEAPLLYENDFEGAIGAEWSSTSTTESPRGGRRVLGLFANDTVTLTLTGLPAHEKVSLCFDAIVVGSWDGHSPAGGAVGPDLLDVSADGVPLLHASFAEGAPQRQSYPEVFQDALGSGSPSHPAQEGADEIDTLGFAAPGDAVYRMAFTLRHSAPTLVVTFRGLNLEGADGESWGLDELQVSAGACRACTARDTVEVTIHPLPAVDAGAPKEACAGTPLDLADSAPGTADAHRWNDGGAGGTFAPSSRVLHPAYTNLRAGDYTLTYTGTETATGCSASDTVDVRVNPAPLVSAGADDTGCAGDPIPLDDAYASGGTTVVWSDGGAGGSFAPSADVLEPTYTNAAAGTYTLTLTATRPSTGCTASDSCLVTVVADPTVDAGAGKQGCAGAPVALSDASSSASTVRWSDGGASGTFSPSADALHPTYTNVAGSYTLTLRATGTAGCVASDTVAVTIHPLPATSAGADKEGCVAQDVALADASSSADGFAWSDGGAGGTFTPGPNVRNPSYRHGSAGARTLTFTATSSATGCSSSDTVVVTFRNPTTAGFTAPATACEDTPVCFTNTSTNGTAWSWTFGDPAGGTSALFEPCYVYSNPGTYTVTLTSSNACGSDDEQRQVTVQPKPVANFSYSTQGGKFCSNKDVEFTDLSTSSPTSWSWDFGDGTTSTLRNPVHAYATDGIFIVRLTACNSCGCGPPKFEAVEIQATCSTNCEANSNQIQCNGQRPTVNSNTCTDHGNFNTTSYPCAPGLSYSGPNKIYDLNFASGANFLITLTETLPEPNGYDLDLMISNACNPPNCVAWGDTTVLYDDRTAANDDYWLIVDGRDGTCGPYSLDVQCLSPAQTASCDPPVFPGIVSAEDEDECSIPGILVTWTAVSDWGAGTTGASCATGHYEIWRAPASDPSDETLVGVAPGSATSFLDGQTVPRRDYRYRVAAVNDCCAEPALPSATDDAFDDFGNAIEVEAGTGGTITCDAPVFQLLGSASGGTGAGFDYAWTPTAGLSDPTVSNPVATIGATYTLTVTDRGDGCRGADTVVVVGNDLAPTANAGPDRVLTCGASSATLAASATGGDASQGYAYSWAPASGVSDPSSPAPTTSTPGTYTLTVEAVATGCTATDTVVVTLSQDPPVANAGPNRELTCSATSVTLDGSAAGGDGSAGYAYSWSPASGVSDPSSPAPATSTPGTYVLTVTALATGCTDRDTVVVIESREPPVASAGPDRQLDCAAGPVTLQGNAFGGDGSDGYAFAWSPPEDVSDATDDRPTTRIPGTYTLTVTDVRTGCTDTDAVVVAADPGAPSANAGSDQAITCLSSSATLSGSASGGDGSQGYSYSWTPAANVSDPAAASTTTSTPGTYTLRVTSIADGCVGLDAVVVADLRGPPEVTAGPDRAITCASAAVTLEGGASGSDGRNGYAYSWSPASQVSDPSAARPTTSTPDTYTLVATDVFTGCSSSDSVVVGTDTAPPTADAGPARTITCAAPVVTLSGAASGGNGSLGYAASWSPTAGLGDPGALVTTATSPGTYTLTITDLANGCTSADTVVVGEDRAPPAADAGPDRVLDCAAGSVTLDGSASGGNGSMGYSYRWEPAANVSDPAAPTTSATAAGVYTLTVTDLANGCADEDTVAVTSPNGPTADAGPDDRVTCATTTADLQGSASGGNGSQGYTYSWSPAAGVANPSAAVTTATAPGVYALTVTDVATGCRAFDTMVVDDGTVPPVAAAGADSRITCAIPSVVLSGSASGGDGSQGYSFAWAPAAGLSDPASATPTASAPATYTLTVTDVATGCTDTDVVVVADGRAAPVASAGADQSRSCAFPTATLAGSASGGDGTSGYTFAWEPSADVSDASSATPTTTSAGTYTLTVTDVASGCTDTDVAIVSDDFAPPVADAGADGVITCNAPLAQLTGSASGGNGSLGYTYRWEPAGEVSNPASATPVALSPGTYTLTVTSRANGCSDTDTVVVADGAQPPVSNAGPDAVIDCRASVVTLQGSASGGDSSLGYAYAWEPAEDVSDPTLASPTTSSPGLYSLTVTALASGCVSTDSVLVTRDVAVPHANAGPDRRIDCDSAVATLSGSATGGNATQGYGYAWSPAGAVANPSSAVTTTTLPGTYTLTVTSIANGCSDTDTIVVTQDGAAPIASAGPDGALGCDGDPVTLSGSASGGNGSGGYSYSWSPASEVASPTSAVTTTTSAGTFTLTVTDLANGCTSADTAVVSSDTATPAASAGPNRRLDCDTAVVTLEGSATGGDASQGYAYRWEPAGLVSNPDVAQPSTSTVGVYTLTVTSIASGCSDSDTVVVTRNIQVPTANAGPDGALDCDTTLVTLAGSATGGDGSQGYAYSWSPAGLVSDPAAASPTTSTAGVYTLTATAIATGCSDIDTVLVVQDVAPPVASAGPDRHLSCATPTATLSGAASGGNGTLGYSYAWTPAGLVSDPAAAEPTTSSPGAFTLTVTDLANGCTATDTVTVTQDVATPTANAGPDRVLDCAAPSVTLNGSASGGNGSAGYAFHWEPSGAVTDPSAAVTQATASATFTLTVTDLANGCTDEDTVVVSSSQVPPVANAGPDSRVTCTDATADLSGTASGGDGSQGYATAWSPAAGVADPSALVTTATVPGTYTLLVEDIATGCRSADTMVVVDDTSAPIAAAGPDRTLTCAQAVVTLSGSASGGNGGAGYGYAWEPAANVSNPAVAQPTTTTAGSYTLTVTDLATGCSATDTVTVAQDLAAPVASAGPDRPLGCSGLAQLQGSASGGNGAAGYAFRWEPAALVSDPNVARPTTTTTGTFTLTVTDLANGCTGTDTVGVVPDSTPPVASAGADLRLTCAAPEVTLAGSASGGNGTSGYAFAWEPAGDVSDPGSATPTTLLPGTYTLTVTDVANGCADTDSVTVTFDQVAPRADAGPDALLDCSAPGTTLAGSASGGNGSAGYSFHWEPAGAVTDPAAAVTTATATGTFTLTVTDLANGCTDADTVVVGSSQPPPIANAGPDDVLGCVSTATLSGSASGGDGRLGYTAAWSPSAGVANPAAFITTTTAPGTYTLTVTDVFTGCRGADVMVVADDASPPVADAGPDAQLDCTSGAATLTGSASGGNGSAGYTYAWTPAALVSNPSSAVTTTTSPGTYTLTVTDRANGCTGTDTVEVTSVAASPIASAGPDQYLTCLASSVVLQGSASGGDGSQGYTYAWTPAGSVTPPSSSTPTTSLSGTYTLTVTDVATGCTATDTVLVLIDRRPPTADAGPSSTISCAAPVATLAGRGGAGNGSLGYSYSWTPTTGVANPAAAVTTTGAPGVYRLTVTDNFTGCTASDTVTILDGGAPPLVSAGPDRVLGCGITSVVLQGSASGGNGSQGYSVQWTPIPGLSSPTVLTPTCDRPGTYTLRVVDVATGCVVTDTVTVIEDRTPPVASAGPDARLTCAQPLAALSGSASGGNGSQGYAFSWTPAAGVTDPVAAATQAVAPGTYTLTVTDVANSCVAVDTVEVTADPNLPRADAGPDQAVSCATPVAALSGSASGGDGSGGYTYAWEPAANVASPTSAVTTTAIAGAYTLTVTDSATGCRAADVVQVVVGTAPPPVEPSALDQRPSATPLRVAWTSAARTTLAVTWEAVAATTHELHEGTLPIAGRGYDHEARGCGLVTPRYTFAPTPGPQYFLAVAAACDGAESSFGRDSFGVERPPSVLGCP